MDIVSPPATPPAITPPSNPAFPYVFMDRFLETALATPC
jgi:hypothetical protein